VQDGFGLPPVRDARELDSYDDRNYWIRVESSEADHPQKVLNVSRQGHGDSTVVDRGVIAKSGSSEFVVKIHNGVDSSKPAFIEAQIAALQRLHRRGIACPVDLEGGGVRELESSGGTEAKSKHRHYVRVLRYVPGRLLYDCMTCKTRDELMTGEIKRLKLQRRLGEFLCQVDDGLQGLEQQGHPSLVRGLVWDLRQFDQIRVFSDAVKDETKRKLIEDIFTLYNSARSARLSRLPCSVIQNDANDRNLVVVGDEENEFNTELAILDFGDMIYTWRICELAIAVAYCVVGFFTDFDESLGDEIWLSRCNALIQGYVSRYQAMSDDERHSIFVLAQARLATSACIGAYSISQAPWNEYLLVHSEPAWRSIRAMRRVGNEAFNIACGLG